jgi:hypothetical protein
MINVTILTFNEDFPSELLQSFKIQIFTCLITHFSSNKNNYHQ